MLLQGRLHAQQEIRSTFSSELRAHLPVSSVFTTPRPSAHIKRTYQTCTLCSENWPRMKLYLGKPGSGDYDTPSNPAGLSGFLRLCRHCHIQRTHAGRTQGRTSRHDLPISNSSPPFRLSLIKLSLAGWLVAFPTSASSPGERGQICGFTLLAGLDSFPEPPWIAQRFLPWAAQNVGCALQGSSWLKVVR